MAEFEHFDAAVDGPELKQMVEKKLGPGWELMVRETSRKNGEQTLIYSHPEGKHMGLFIVDKDNDELDVVQISVDPDHLNESIGKYDHQRATCDTDRDIEDWSTFCSAKSESILRIKGTYPKRTRTA